MRKPAEVKAPEEPIPEVEWWDVGLLQNKLYEIVAEDISGLREDKITIYVEHPVPLEPPAEEAQPPPMPLPLTQRVGVVLLACLHACIPLSCTKVLVIMLMTLNFQQKVLNKEIKSRFGFASV